MYSFGKKDLKLFLGVSAGLLIFLMLFLPPNNWWFLWDYLETTPFILVIGQAWPIWGLAGLITMFLILVRELTF